MVLGDLHQEKNTPIPSSWHHTGRTPEVSKGDGVFQSNALMPRDVQTGQLWGIGTTWHTELVTCCFCNHSSNYNNSQHVRDSEGHLGGQLQSFTGEPYPDGFDGNKLGWIPTIYGHLNGENGLCRNFWESFDTLNDFNDVGLGQKLRPRKFGQILGQCVVWPIPKCNGSTIQTPNDSMLPMQGDESIFTELQ